MTIPAPRKIQIAGAGMNGLLAAYYLLEKGFQVEVFESSTKVGGKIQTVPTQLGLRELSANAILADHEVEAVAEKIGIVLVEKSQQAQKRWILKNGRPSGWPVGFLGSLALSRFVFSLIFKSKAFRPLPRELLWDWGFRVIGKDATDYLLSPACQGIFGVDAGSLSATLIYNYFFGKEKRILGKLRGSVTPTGGMGEFPQKLRQYLETQGVVFHLNKKLEKKDSEPVVLAADWQQAQEFLRLSGDSRADVLAGLPGVDLVSVNVFFKEEPLKQKPGFGLLFPRKDSPEFSAPLGVLFNHFIFPKIFPRGSETWIFGGGHPQSLSDGDFLNSILSVRKKIWESTSTPQEFFVNRWTKAIPLYGLELEKNLGALSQDQNGIYLAGNYLGELGLNRFFHRARALAEKISTLEGA